MVNIDLFLDLLGLICILDDAQKEFYFIEHELYLRSYIHQRLPYFSFGSFIFGAEGALDILSWVIFFFYCFLGSGPVGPVGVSLLSLFA